MRKVGLGDLSIIKEYERQCELHQILQNPFLVTNDPVKPLYVSLQAALAHDGLIPEYVAEAGMTIVFCLDNTS